MHEKIAQLRDFALKHDFAAFIEKSFGTINPGTKFLPNWHIDLIAEYLKACENGQIKRLIINVPPRYLKSICVNVAWPAWLLGHNPERRIISASYAQSLSEKHSLDARRVMQAGWYHKIFPQTILLGGENKKNKFVTSKMGFRFATSVGGSVTGEGGDVLIIDDPHNPTTVNSKKIRQQALDWFDKSFASRLNNKKTGCMVVIMQRLHVEDLTGYLEQKNSWEKLVIPAISEKRRVISFGNFNHERQAKSLLHEARESLTEIKAVKRDLGSQGFAAQYQQQPVVLGGNIVKINWFERYEEGSITADNKNIVISLDSAIKKTAQSDYSVFTIWKYQDNKYFLLQVIRKKLAFDELINEVTQCTRQFNPSHLLVEDKSSGQSLIQILDGKTSCKLVKVSPKKDKFSRFVEVLPMLENKQVVLPKVAPWLNEYEEEITSFPASSHDDQVDSTTQFLTWARHYYNFRGTIRRII